MKGTIEEARADLALAKDELTRLGWDCTDPSSWLPGGCFEAVLESRGLSGRLVHRIRVRIDPIGRETAIRIEGGLFLARLREALAPISMAANIVTRPDAWMEAKR